MAEGLRTAAVSRPMTSANFANHAAMNNNNRPAYNANGNANNRPAFNANANANNHPAYNANNPAGLQQQCQQCLQGPDQQRRRITRPRRQAQPHQGGGQPHNESHPSSGGGEHEHR